MEGASLADDFESAMGTGAQIATFYETLTEPEAARWERWFRMYREMGLASGEYLNLYDLAFDRPEAHVVRKGGALYYGLFAELWNQNRPLALRGLDRDKTYEVYDYANERPLGTVSGSNPRLKVSFKGSLLLRVRPVSATKFGTTTR